MFVIRVTNKDKTLDETVETSPWTVRQWELHFKLKLSKLAERGFGMDDYIFLSWRELTDRGDISIKLEEYGKSLAICELVSKEKDEPTETEIAEQLLSDPNSHTPSGASDA